MVYRGRCGSHLDDECASPSLTMSGSEINLAGIVDNDPKQFAVRRRAGKDDDIPRLDQYFLRPTEINYYLIAITP